MMKADIPAYLSTCKEPRTVKQIATALLDADREFETKRPVIAVRALWEKAGPSSRGAGQLPHTSPFQLQSLPRCDPTV